LPDWGVRIHRTGLGCQTGAVHLSSRALAIKGTRTHARIAHIDAVARTSAVAQPQIARRLAAVILRDRRCDGERGGPHCQHRGSDDSSHETSLQFRLDGGRFLKAQHRSRCLWAQLRGPAAAESRIGGVTCPVSTAPQSGLGSGGVIRNSRNLNFHEIFFGQASSKRARKAVGRRPIRVPRGN